MDRREAQALERRPFETWTADERAALVANARMTGQATPVGKEAF